MSYDLNPEILQTTALLRRVRFGLLFFKKKRDFVTAELSQRAVHFRDCFIQVLIVGLKHVQ